MRLDWYSATVPVRAGLLVDGIREGMGGVIAQVETQRGTNNYAASEVCTDVLGQRVCAVLHGGSNGLPHVRASGVYSPRVANVLRDRWPGHSVSRADVAVDFDGDGCWDKLHAVCEDVARESGLKWMTYGDFRQDRDEAAGRTVYVGSRQSAVMVRLYEKGKKVLPTVRIGEESPSLNWCRLEVEVKPSQKEARIAASSWPVEQFWGCAAWSRKLLRRASGADVERIMMTVRKETNARRAVRHMAMQYRQAIETVIAEDGGQDEALMRLVREIWAEADRFNRAA